MPNTPNRTVEDFARAAGANVRVMWQMPGPNDTGVAWLECLMVGDRGDMVIIETFKHGGWNAFTAPHSNRVDDTLIDVMRRCGVKAPPKWQVMKDGEKFDVLTAPTLDAVLDAARAKGGEGRYSAIEVA